MPCVIPLLLIVLIPLIIPYIALFCPLDCFTFDTLINIADVGFGISQSLPIIVEGINIHKEQTLLLEQPEIHLHPKMQMKLADFFISMAVSKKKIIIETHSDHIINRLIRRIMEDKKYKLEEMIAIYFIEQNNKISDITKISIDKIKGITFCPNDFFSQYASETEKISDIGLDNLRKMH